MTKTINKSQDVPYTGAEHGAHHLSAQIMGGSVFMFYLKNDGGPTADHLYYKIGFSKHWLPWK